MADLKSLQKKVFDAVDKSPRKEDESVGDYEKRLSKKYPLLKKQVNKLTLAEKTALWGDQESRTAAGFGTKIGNVPDYPGKPKKPKPKRVSKKELQLRGPFDERGNLIYKHGRGREDPYYGLGMPDPGGYEDIKKGGKIKKNYSKGGGVRPASY